MSTTDTADLEAFLASMPAAYRAAFDGEAFRAHESIVRRRTGRAIHVEIWRDAPIPPSLSPSPSSIVTICVVADDRPGLLSCISSAMVAMRIDVVSAHAYCRKRKGRAVEAVDFLWIRRLPDVQGAIPPIEDGDIVAIAEAIASATASGDRSVESEPVPSASSGALSGRATARVRFDNDTKDGSTVLTVEAVDRPGLLLAVTQALFRSGLQIVGLRATTQDGAAVDQFHVAEVDGSALASDRLLTLQTAILGAIDEGTMGRRRSTG